MPLQKEDIILGAEYEFCDPEFPQYWGHRGVAIRVGSLVTVRSTRDSDRCTFVPIGSTGQHEARQLKLVQHHESELLFS